MAHLQTAIGSDLDRSSAYGRFQAAQSARTFETANLWHTQDPAIYDGITASNVPIGLTSAIVDYDSLIRLNKAVGRTWGKEQAQVQRLPTTPYLARGMGNIALDNELRFGEQSSRTTKSANEYGASGIYRERVDADVSSMSHLRGIYGYGGVHSAWNGELRVSDQSYMHGAVPVETINPRRLPRS